MKHREVRQGARRRRPVLWATTIVLLTCCIVEVSAQIRMTRDDALEAYFPGAAVERQTAFLTDEEVRRIQQRSQARVDSKVLTYYVARRNGRLTGTAFLETRTVRTMPVTFIAVVAPDSSIRAVEILAFHEPDDYAPPGRWLAQFTGRRLTDDLFLKRGIHTMAGATLTAQVLSDGARRLLASYEVVVAPKVTDR